MAPVIGLFIGFLALLLGAWYAVAGIGALLVNQPHGVPGGPGNLLAALGLFTLAFLVFRKARRNGRAGGPTQG